jgi:hypothetical protein
VTHTRPGFCPRSAFEFLRWAWVVLGLLLLGCGAGSTATVTVTTTSAASSSTESFAAGATTPPEIAGDVRCPDQFSGTVVGSEPAFDAGVYHVFRPLVKTSTGTTCVFYSQVDLPVGGAVSK